MSKEVGSLSVEVNITAGDPPQVHCRFKVEGPGVSEQVKAVETAILELFAKSAVEVFTKTSGGEKSSERPSGQQSPRQPQSPDQGQGQDQGANSNDNTIDTKRAVELGKKVFETILESDKVKSILGSLKEGLQGNKKS